ncbi:hypothetical protein AK830_g5443 [Neonectria ditissima]|uniref:Alpha/beta hydrolase fold-3 domain-containing protein n=1 Tax=Neonectria ditissima TaxID=78410 RepID=A0A0P7BKX0_9HYPO|nr:hypothetical protein AK830_g5443 [Neonectria ditissima]
MSSTPPRPPYDAELAAVLSTLGFPHTMTTEHIKPMRGVNASADPAKFNEHYVHKEVTIPGPGGDLILSVFQKRSPPPQPTAAIYHIHGGGMIIGNRFAGVTEILGYIQDFDAVLVSVEYRLAPENPDPAPIEDCFAGLEWVSANAAELGADPNRVIIAGSSAGGGLAAGVSILARDRGSPKIYAQMLLCAMLDDRNQTVSSKQYVEVGTWSRGSNLMAWKCLLGERQGGDDVSVYASPSRATDLSGLPTAFIDVGASEVFRDEDVAYASRLWECGVQAELHVWPGAFHAFELLAPGAAVSVAALKARGDWLRRILSQGS